MADDKVFAPWMDVQRNLGENLEKAFAELDKDKSGYIEAKELEKFIELRLQDPNCDASERKYFSSPANVKKHVEHFMKEADKDQDSKVTSDEYIAYYVKRWVPIPSVVQAVTKAFHEQDVDKNGYIDGRDLEKLIQSALTDPDLSPEEREFLSVPENVKQHIEDFMKVLDKNSDGKVTLDEYLDYYISKKVG